MMITDFHELNNPIIWGSSVGGGIEWCVRIKGNHAYYLLKRTNKLGDLMLTENSLFSFDTEEEAYNAARSYYNRYGRIYPYSEDKSEKVNESQQMVFK